MVLCMPPAGTGGIPGHFYVASYFQYILTYCFNVFFQIQQLQKKDLQLKALDAFYKEQLAQLEEKVKGYTLSPDRLARL